MEIQNPPVRVLVVEDEERDFLVLRDLLSIAGNRQFLVDRRADFESALAAIERDTFDICLLDDRIGGRSGLEIMKKAAASGCKAPVIFLTGSEGEGAGVEAMRAGASDCLNKGELSAGLLERAIRYSLESRRSREELQRVRTELEAMVRERTEELSNANAFLKREREWLFSLLDLLPGQIYIRASDHSIRFASTRFREVFGDTEGKRCYEALRKRAKPCRRCPSQEIFDTQRPKDWIAERPLDGRAYHVYSHPIQDVDGSTLVMELGLDITESLKAERIIQKRDEWFQLSLEGTKVSLWDWDIPSGKVVFFRHWAELAGYPPGEWEDHIRMFRRSIHPGDVKLVMDNIREHFEGKTPFYMTEHRIRTKSGGWMWMVAKGRVVTWDSEGRPIRAVGFYIDVTERREAENLLCIQRDLALTLGSSSDMNEVMSSILDAALRIDAIDSGGVYLVDSVSGELSLIAHKGLSKFFVDQVSTYSAEALQTQLVMIGEPIYLSCAIDTFLETGELMASEGLLALASIPVKYEGKVLAVLNLASHTHSEILPRTRIALEATAAQLGGILSRVKAEAALKMSEEERRLLSRRLLSAQEEERKRIAADLHDSVSSSLTAVKLNLEGVRSQLEQGKAGPGGIDYPIAWLQKTIDETRRLIGDLRPSVLDHFGIIASIGSILRQYRTICPDTRFELDVRIEEDQIPVELKIVIFRIVQEALSNMAKYSQADLVNISLAGTGDQICLAIEDNGVGFLAEAKSLKRCEKGGLGLVSMRERAEFSGGVFSLTSSPAEGTAIRVEWPWAGSAVCEAKE